MYTETNGLPETLVYDLEKVSFLLHGYQLEGNREVTRRMPGEVVNLPQTSTSADFSDSRKCSLGSG